VAPRPVPPSHQILATPLHIVLTQSFKLVIFFTYIDYNNDIHSYYLPHVARAKRGVAGTQSFLSAGASVHQTLTFRRHFAQVAWLFG